MGAVMRTILGLPLAFLSATLSAAFAGYAAATAALRIGALDTNGALVAVPIVAVAATLAAAAVARAAGNLLGRPATRTRGGLVLAATVAVGTAAAVPLAWGLALAETPVAFEAAFAAFFALVGLAAAVSAWTFRRPGGHPAVREG